MTDTKIQFNLTFVPIEDRILFRIATGTPGVAMEEYRLWLTRRFVRLLCDALEGMIEIATDLDPRVPPEGRNAFKEFQQSAALTQTDFATPYAADKATASLGANPLLVHSCQTKKTSDKNQILSLKATTGQTINITLNLQLIHSLRKLLTDMIKTADWNLQDSVVVPGAGRFVSEAPKTIN